MSMTDRIPTIHLQVGVKSKQNNNEGNEPTVVNNK